MIRKTVTFTSTTYYSVCDYMDCVLALVDDARAISASEYNSLRQLSKRASGGLSVSYGYGIGGALNFISSAPFTQRIARETMACASGLVTSVSSKFGSDAFATASYEYDNLGRLAQAKEGGSVRSSFAYNLNGSPTSIARCGVADREGGEAVYGYIDRATLAYDGNRLASSSDRAQYLSYAGANDLPNGEGEYGYDANGNMAFDTGRGIDSVAYNRLNLPLRVACSDRSVVTFEYDNLGAKLAEVDSIPALAIIRPPIGLKTFPSIGGEIALKPVCKVTRTEYCGSCVYVGGKLARLLFPGGYATSKGGGEGFDYHYYVCDYLGSVRAVVAEDGTVEETNDYYPYGMQKPGADGALGQAQPYKYGGKERLSAAGLNLYDFGPRALYSPAAQFASMDPKCEDYPHLSPYLYCAANPVNAIDPTGEDVAVLLVGGFPGHMALLVQNSEGKWIYYSFNGVDCPAGNRQIHDKGVDGGWSSPQEFLNSDYNRKAEDAGIKDHNTQEVCDYNYAKACVIKTSKEQDQKIINAFDKSTGNGENKAEKYDVTYNNCAIVVQRSLEAGGVIPKSKSILGGIPIPVTISVPNPAQFVIPTPVLTMVKFIDPRHNPVPTLVYNRISKKTNGYEVNAK